MDKLEAVMERWPGYNQQSWSQRFAELDRQMQQRNSEMMALLKQFADHETQSTIIKQPCVEQTIGKVAGIREGLEMAAKACEIILGGALEALSRATVGGIAAVAVKGNVAAARHCINAIRVKVDAIERMDHVNPSQAPGDAV